MDKEFMRLAIQEANRCIPSEGAFSVGAVLVLQGDILATGYSREIEGNTHAEECCFLKVSECRGATIYTTMEPCGQRLSGKTSCAQRILDAGIHRVVQGIQEPPNFVGQSIGTKILLEGGVQVDYLPGFEEACLAPNLHLMK
jgi:pyrimidine deaminase RibD-like protein